jgi:hypothetical protein
MTFLSPIWFFALAALSVPVFIHLWNIREGKTLKVGSISLISEASKSNRRSFKLLDVLLLIVRCLLLGLLALFLASPIWQHLKAGEKIKGWLLIPQGDFTQSYNKFKPRIDSLIRRGYELHFYHPDFMKVDTADLRKGKLPKAAIDTLNYWSLLNQLSNKASNIPVELITPNGSIHFKGSKPNTQLNLNWQTYTVADSVSKWIAVAAFTNTNAIKVTLGSSNPGGISYTNRVLQNEGDGEIALNVENGKPLVALKDSVQPAVAVDTSTLRIAIYTDKYLLDAGYLKAALSAAVGFSGRKSIIKQYFSPGQIPSGQAWLFWLSDKPVNKSLLRSRRYVFKYEAGKANDISSWINPVNQFALAIPGKRIELNKIVSATANSEPVWQDGYGRPVLGLEDNIYHFYTHFNPLWNNLVWSEDFPKLILKLIGNEPYRVPAQFDKRVLSDAQLQPIRVKAANVKASADPVEQTDLSGYFWLALIVLLIAERILSHKKHQQTNG